MLLISFFFKFESEAKFIFLKYLIGGLLLSHAVLISAVQHWESVITLYIMYVYTCVYRCVCVHAKSCHLCLPLRCLENSMTIQSMGHKESDTTGWLSFHFTAMIWSPPGSSVHGILRARILEWVAIPSFRGSSQPGDWKQSAKSPALLADSLPAEPSGSLIVFTL